MLTLNMSYPIFDNNSFVKSCRVSLCEHKIRSPNILFLDCGKLCSENHAEIHDKILPDLEVGAVYKTE